MKSARGAPRNKAPRYIFGFKKTTSNTGETLKYFQLSSSRNNETKIQGFRMAVLKRMLCKVQIRICSIVVVMVT